MTKQVDISRATFRIMHETPGHVTYGIWINGGKSGELIIRQSERRAFEALLLRASMIPNLPPNLVPLS